MTFAARGGPLHTRTLSITLTRAEPPLVGFQAYVLDLRKRGFAPVGGDLQATGIIHHMQLEGLIDVDRGTIREVASRMPAVAFEARPATGGDTCREVSGRTALLAGVALDDEFARGVASAIGGPRGCSHVLTLALLLGPTVRWALAEDAAMHGTAPARRLGERIFRRDVTIDGYELPSSDLLFTAQLNDLLCAPAPALAAPMDRFARQHELRLAVETSFQKLVIRSAEAEERRRDVGEFLTAAWVDRSSRLEALVGQSMRHGITQTLLAHFAEAGADAPLRDTLLQLPPTSVQCYAALDLWTQRISEAGSADTGGWPDSCWIWRREGFMSRSREQAITAGRP